MGLAWSRGRHQARCRIAARLAPSAAVYGLPAVSGLSAPIVHCRTMWEEEAPDLGQADESALARKSVEFVSRIRARDESVWRDLSDQYESLLRWIARRCRLSPEDIDDVVQLTWLRCLERIDQLTDPERLSGWLTTICRRECIRLATKGRREIPLSGPELARLIDNGPDDDPYVKVAVRDQHNRLHHAISALPERQKRLLAELMRQEGQSYLDLSRRLGLPVGSIGPTRRRAVTRLRLDPRIADLSSEISDDHPQARSA